MKKRTFILLFSILFLCKQTVCAQDSLKNVPFFIPQTTSLNVNSNFHWFISESTEKKLVDQIYIRAKIKYSKNIQFIVTNKIKYKNYKWQNKISDIYLNYTNTFNDKNKFFFLKNGTYLNLKIGKQEWHPTYTNVQLILENAEQFVNPSQIYGGSIILKMPLTKEKSLNFNFSAHTGDLIYNNLAAEILDIYLNYTKILEIKLGMSAQIGIAQGSKHIVNFAHLLYQPELEKIKFDIKLGKLQTYDETPYGIHIGLKRKFKYLSLGGYFEKRINQNTKGNIAGIQWNIIGPPKLAKFISTFNFTYDFNTNTVWMWIPIIKIDIQHK